MICTAAGILPSLDGDEMEMIPLSANLVYAFRSVSRFTASRYEMSPCAYRVLPNRCAWFTTAFSGSEVCCEALEEGGVSISRLMAPNQLASMNGQIKKQ